MKNLLFIVILAVSLNAFAQSKKPQHPFLSSPQGFMNKMGNPDLNSPLIYPEELPGQVISRHATAPRGLIQLYDSIYYWNLDTATTAWRPDHKYVDIVYDAGNNLMAYTEQNWNDTAWNNSSRYTYTYDVNHNQTGETNQFWDGSAWQNSSLYITIYDINDNLITETWQRWENALWANQIQYIYTYDANNNCISKLKQIGNGSGWENWSVQTNSYDVNNNILSEHYQLWQEDVYVNWMQHTYTYDTYQNLTIGVYQQWYDTTWINQQKYIQAFDENHNITSIIIQGWNQNESEWKNVNKFTYAYNTEYLVTSFINQAYNTTDSTWRNSACWTYGYMGGLLATTLYQTWDVSNWLNYSLKVNEYDMNNNNTISLIQYWKDEIWVLGDKSSTTYDDNNFLLSSVSRRWDYSGINVILGDSTHYYFHTVVGINDLTAQDKFLSISPNPSSGNFTLISSAGTIGSVEIYNLIGDLIYSDSNLSRLTSKEINLSSAPKGIYFVKIRSGEKVHSSKIVIQ
jgi:hypothetical protein